MAQNSDIEWTDATWTPVVGCDAVSPGCANCYAATMASRLEAMGQGKYAGLATRVGGKGKWTGKVTLSEADLFAPLRRRKPTKWFLTSMGDVFHDAVPFDFIDRLFAVMAMTPHHTFQVLTKRPSRLVNYLSGNDRGHRIMTEMHRMRPTERKPPADPAHVAVWPVPHIWFGCTAEDQQRADERRHLMEHLSVVGWRTFVSYEPALGMVDWSGWEFLSWLISGGESGPGARPSHPDWHRTARDYCAVHGIPYLFKQHGDWGPNLSIEGGHGSDYSNSRIMWPDGSDGTVWFADAPVGGCWMRRVGKKAAGRHLDGVLHDGYPA